MGNRSSAGLFYHKLKRSVQGQAHDSGQNGVDRLTLWKSWEMIVCEYTRRRITFDTDKLVAFQRHK